MMSDRKTALGFWKDKNQLEFYEVEAKCLRTFPSRATTG